MTTNMFIIPIDYEMTTQREHNAGDLPDCKEIKGDQWGSPFFHCVACCHFAISLMFLEANLSGCQSTTELSK